MRIVHIAAGAGSMYCGACARDLALVKGLSLRGHDVEIVPLYTPLKMDIEDALHTSTVFYGGINVFLQQISSLFRKMPKSWDRWLDNSRLLNAVSGFAINTSPKHLGPMTVSVLAGLDGKQGKELDRLMEYLETAKPNLVSITNSMLSAIAPEIKKRFGVPIICGLQGEESFIEAMPVKYAKKARELMQCNIEHIDRLTVPTDAYASKMREYLGVDADKIAVLPVGIDTDLYARKASRVHSPFTICYLSVISKPKGLDILVEAFARGMGDAKLLIAGRVMDKKYWKNLLQQVNKLGISGKFHHLGEVPLHEKLAVFNNCSAFVLPTRIPESRGVVLMEAMSCNLPVVAPEHGVFTELIEHERNGILFDPGNVQSLYNALLAIQANEQNSEYLAANAAKFIRERYNIDVAADTAVKIYTDLLT